jgi:2-polyprenyl-6-hydroxyphenyl methylase/3-demethylubiquinone-9 3-methyltransferase
VGSINECQVHEYLRMNTGTSSTRGDGNFSQVELDKFNELANRWWDPDGPQKALHALNPTRLGYVAARAALRGAQVLDVGCGAGLLSEALAGEGARVIALDLAPDLVKVAKLHRLESGIEVDYRLQSVESLATEMPGGFDAVTCMEMLEHVPDPASIINACATLLKPGGRLFVSTLNRTPAAFALAIVGAEYIARLLPRGTHQYREFIKPSELAACLRTAGLELEDVSGLVYEPWRNSARISRRTDVNYLACARKPG